MTPKAIAYAESIETEAAFFEALARTCEGVGEPALAAAATSHAAALRRRLVLALEEPTPKPKAAKPAKPAKPAKAAKPKAPVRRRPTGWSWPK